MADLFREFFWIIFPVMGMGIGAFAIWNEFSRQRKALDVLKVYAEKGAEPPASVLEVLNRASSSRGAIRRQNSNGWGRFVFFLVMGVGFAGVAVWSAQGGPRMIVFVMSFSIIAFSMAAIALRELVTELTTMTSNRADER